MWRGPLPRPYETTQKKQLRAALRRGGAQSREGGGEHVARAPPATHETTQKKQLRAALRRGGAQSMQNDRQGLGRADN